MIKAILLMLLLPSIALAGTRVVREFTPSDFDAVFHHDAGGAIDPQGMPLHSVAYFTRDNSACVVSDDKAPGVVPVLTIDHPKLSGSTFTLTGFIQYGTSESRGNHFEVVNEYPDGSHVTTYALPNPTSVYFDVGRNNRFSVLGPTDRATPPSRMILNFVMPKRASVSISAIKLIEDISPSTAPAAVASWNLPPANEKVVREFSFVDWAGGQQYASDGTIDGEATVMHPQGSHDIVGEAYSSESLMINVDTRAVKKTRSWTLVQLDNPPLTGGDFALAGSVSYSNVVGDAYIELQAELPDGTTYSRTLAAAGSMRKISGTSDSRDFRVPFNLASHVIPTRLVARLVLPGSGDVTVSAVSLVEPAPAVAAHPAATGDTPTDRLTHLIGLTGIGRHFAVVYCTLITGCLALSILMRSLMKRGKGKALMTAFSIALMACGVLQIFAAGVAFGAGKPSDAWATLLGSSAILLFVPALTLRDLSRKYAQFELRKLSAMDVG